MKLISPVIRQVHVLSDADGKWHQGRTGFHRYASGQFDQFQPVNPRFPVITGTRVHLCIRSDDAKYQFTVDGTIFELPVTGRFNDPQCIALGAPTTLSSDLLPQGAHRAELTVLEASPSSEFRFFGGVAVSELVVDMYVCFPVGMGTVNLSVLGQRAI